MGRQFVYRHRLKSEAASVKAKTLFDYLVSQVKARREVSFDEAVLIAGDAWQYLNNYLGMKQLGTLEFPAVVDEGDAYFRRSRIQQNEKLVCLTILEDDDADLLAEFGVRTMVTGRMARVIEEAYHQGALLDFNRLCLLFPLNVSAIRERLMILIDQGAALPLAGMTKQTGPNLRRRGQCWRWSATYKGKSLLRSESLYASAKTSGGSGGTAFVK